MYTDLTLAYIFDHAVCCASAASSGRSLHLITSQLRTKYSSSNCPNHVRRTKSSVKKQIIVRRTVRSMFGEQTCAQLRTGFTFDARAEGVGRQSGRAATTTTTTTTTRVLTLSSYSLVFTSTYSLIFTVQWPLAKSLSRTELLLGGRD